MKPKPLCLHFHLYKNAGASVEGALSAWFGKDFYRVDGPVPEGEISAVELADFLKKHPRTRAVSSHQCQFPVPRIENWEILPFLFLRHPLDRVYSVYFYEQRNPDNMAGSAVAMQKDLRGYVDWRLSRHESRLIANYQTAVLGGRGEGTRPRLRLGQTAFQRARRRLRALTVLGVVEKFDESMILAEHILEPHFPGIDLSCVKRNVRPGRPGSLAERLEEGRRQLGQDGLAELMRRNQMDFELYACACEELERRLQDLGDYSGRLRNFRARCERRRDRLPENAGSGRKGYFG